MPGARIESFDVRGPAGRLEGLLKRPASGAAPAAAVVCHPHPLFGGTMHNKVVHAAAEALAGLGLEVARFNFRGVGRSAGRHDGGAGEQDDLRAVLDALEARAQARPLLVAGYSFGAWVGLRVGCTDPRVAALVGIAAPVGLFPFGFLRACGKPLALVQGEADPLAPLGLVLAMAAALPGGARVLPVPGADHSFNGRLDDLSRRVVEAVPAEFLASPR